MTLRNLRAYTQNKDDTLSTVTPSNYETGTGANARLRKINLNVDIATQAELNEAFNLLSNAIEDISTGTLSNYYTKPEVNDISTALSTALTGEIDAEATARKEADNAIKASLSAYALSTTVADAYKVTVVKDETPETSAYVATYHVEQNGRQVGASINIPKDYVVKDAALCTVTEAGVPYPEAQVNDKYIDFTVNTAESDDAKHIYLPVKDLVDVYTGGSTTFADVNVDNNRVITVNVNADTISAAAVAAVVGQDGDASSANTIYGAKKYADEVAAAVAVSAEGETGEGALVSADDANNMITVGSTQKLQDAVAAAETAVTYIEIGAPLTSLITVEGNTSLTSTGSVKLNATDRLTDVVNVVRTTSADWSAAETNAKAYTDTVSAALSTSLHNELTAETTARETADTALSNAINALSGSVNGASGDDYVTATVEDNKVKVSATDKLTAVVDKVEQTSATWDAAAPLTALEAEQTARADADTALSTAINALSATYASKTIVDSAATTLEAAAALTAKDLTAYNDIDEIIQELEDLKAAVKTFAGSVKSA